ncbi:Methyltransferase type 11 [Catenulispora acidiphila DSM 44928]|uniref:Methyltransferase type 11 n=2 Tax=Catenulispora TaxID=414878 RepID=C7QDP7_CATAD|nr:Methyltransferase type 11 [Catenulispora acidiphila DSM 44928]
MADVLDLDAEVVGAYLDELTAWARSHTKTAPHTIVDIGAGTGSGTFALARRFEAAEVIAIDQSPTMLDRLQSAAASRGVAGRLRTVQADLDAGWPAIGTADLAWAASSLHHVADPDRVLADVHAALNPGGLLVVVEMDAMPRFLPEGVYPGLEQRCRAIADGNGWNSWPNWTSHLERAGFTVAEEQVFDIDVRPAPPAANRYAHRVMSGMRNRLAEQLSPEDLAAMDRLLDPENEESVLRRGDLAVRSVRTAWAAQRS